MLIVLSLGILFPFYLFRQFSPAYRTGFDWLFHTGISHMVARLIFYGMLAWLIFSVFSNKRRLYHPIIVVLVVLVIAIMQESIQLISGQGPLGLDDIFDIVVDLSGALIGLFAFRWRWNKKNKDQLTNSQIN